jgi:hypothetical protein
MNRSVLVVVALGALVAAAVVAALVFSPSPAVDLGRGRPQKPTESLPDGTNPIRSPEGNGPARPPVSPVSGDPAVSGVVADAQGNPVAGAEVLLYDGERRFPAVTVSGEEEARRHLVGDLFQYRTEEVSTLRPLSSGPGPVTDEAPVARAMTAENGEFRIADPPPGMLGLVARKEALASPEVSARRGSKVRLVIGETASIRGLVRSADDGRMLPGATVRVAVAGLAFNATSAADGTFALPGLPGGPASVVTTHPEFAGDSRRDIALLPGREKELEIQLTKGLRLTVTVTGIEGDEPTGPVVAGATVGLVRTSDKVYAVGTTGEDGKVVFEGLPTGDWLVNASRDGFLPSGEEKIVLSETKEWELSMEKAVYTTLKVVDERGVVVADAEVFTGNADEEFEMGASRRAGATDQAGELAFPFDWMGRDAVAFVMKPGYGAGIVQPQDPSAGEPITVVLRPGIALRGQVTDFAGKPAAGAKVYVEVSVEDVASDDLYVTLYADSDGRYSLPCLPVGSVWVEVEAEGHDAADADFEAEPGSGEIVRDFRLEKAK